MVDDFAEALLAAQGGDEAAFTHIFRTMQPVVLRYLVVLAGESNAEDLAAETWVAALRTFTAFRGDQDAMRGWLLTIARARWVDAVRVHARRSEQVTAEVPEARGPEDVAGRVEMAEATRDALALIATLPPDQAEVVTLRVIGELDVPEVAELLGKTPNHVRVLSHRGLRRLAAVMRDAPISMDSRE